MGSCMQPVSTPSLERGQRGYEAVDQEVASSTRSVHQERCEIDLKRSSNLKKSTTKLERTLENPLTASTLSIPQKFLTVSQRPSLEGQDPSSWDVSAARLNSKPRIQTRIVVHPILSISKGTVLRTRGDHHLIKSDLQDIQDKKCYKLLYGNILLNVPHLDDVAESSIMRRRNH